MVAGQARDHEDGIEDAALVELVGQRQQALARHLVDLVEREDGAASRALQPLDDALGIAVEAAHRIDQQRRWHRHRAVPAQAAATMARSSRRRGAKMPGVSTKMSCAAPRMAMPSTRGARRLHLGRDDRHLAADEHVDQRRLAGIGRADDRDRAAAPRGLAHALSSSAASAAAAAAVSAARLEAPVAVAGGKPSTPTVMVKRRRWAGPSVATVR